MKDLNRISYRELKQLFIDADTIRQMIVPDNEVVHRVIAALERVTPRHNG